jgi:hypothetical protein
MNVPNTLCRLLAGRARAGSSTAFVLATLAAFGAPVGAQAQSMPVVTGTAMISPGALAGSTGVLSVNEAAGLDNGQSNQTAIVIGTSGGVYNGGSLTASAAARVPSATAKIEGDAFSNTSGAVLVNQASGAANLQRNSVILGAGAMGVETVSDSELSAAAPRNGSLAHLPGVRSEREATISTDAFKNASGIVQINQTAGAGNATANSFVLRPPAGTFF